MQANVTVFGARCEALAVWAEADCVDRTEVALDRAVKLGVRDAVEQRLKLALARGRSGHIGGRLTTAHQHVQVERRHDGPVQWTVGLKGLLELASLGVVEL